MRISLSLCCLRFVLLSVIFQVVGFPIDVDRAANSALGARRTC
jgi:hypothetical protein